MTIEEFAVRLDELDNHLVSILHLFEKDTGVKVSNVTVHAVEDGAYDVCTGLDFPEPEKAE